MTKRKRTTKLPPPAKPERKTPARKAMTVAELRALAEPLPSARVMAMILAAQNGIETIAADFPPHVVDQVKRMMAISTAAQNALIRRLTND